MTKTKNSFKRRYKMRALGENGLNVVVSIPKVVLERAALKHKLSIKLFIKMFCAVAHYDDHEGIYYTFERTDSGQT